YAGETDLTSLADSTAPPVPVTISSSPRIDPGTRGALVGFHSGRRRSIATGGVTSRSSSVKVRGVATTAGGGGSGGDGFGAAATLASASFRNPSASSLTSARFGACA